MIEAIFLLWLLVTVIITFLIAMAVQGPLDRMDSDSPLPTVVVMVVIILLWFWGFIYGGFMIRDYLLTTGVVQ